MSGPVLHVTSTFPRRDGDPTGGFVADLVAAEAASGMDVSVVAPHDAGLAVDGVVAGVPVHRFRYGPERMEVLAYRGGLLASVRRPLGLLMVPAYLVAMSAAATVAARRRRAAVLHAHWWFPGGAAALVAGRLLGRPVAITLHGSDVALARRRGWRRLARAVVRRAAVVTAVSESLAAEAAAVLGVGGIRVVPMPVAAPGNMAEPGPPPPPPLRLLAAGRLTPEKGFDVLIAAVRGLADDGVDVELVLVGDGPERDRLRAAGRALGLRLRMPGALPQPELHRLMGDVHAVVVPSRREGLGLVAVEAMAAGRPVVASRVGGLADAVEDQVDGLLVQPDDPAALADALRRLPMPAPRGRAVGRHAPGLVATAFGRLYQEAEDAGPARRWRPLRWLGAATALAVLGVLVRVAVRDWPAIHRAWRHPSWAGLAVAGAASVTSEIGFGLASAQALVAIAGHRASRWRVAAAFWVAQTAKNIPGGVWTALARAGVATGWGVGPRQTLGWLGTEAVASVAAGTFVGGTALAVAAAGGPTRLVMPAWIVLAGLGLVLPLALARRGPVARVLTRLAVVAPSPAQVARTALAYIPVWVAAGVALAGLCRAVAPLDGRSLVLAAGAGCVASVVGFLAVPVPSGLGIRELVLVALLQPVMPTAVAASVTLASRVLALVVQTALAGAALPALPRR